MAIKNLGKDESDWNESIETDLIFLCLFGIEDPLCPEAPSSVSRCQQSGTKIRMVTGDNPETAKKIAQQCGIYQEGGICMTGPEFREMYLNDPQKLIDLLPNLQVLARSSPEDKYILVRELKNAVR